MNFCVFVDSYKKYISHTSPHFQIGAGGIGFDVAEYLLHHDDGGKDKVADDVDLQEFWTEWGVDTTSNAKRGGLVEPQHSVPQREIVLLQRKKGKLGKNLGKTTGWIHRAMLTKSGAVEMLGGVTYDKVDEDGNLHIIDQDKKRRVLEVDNIVVCAGQLVHNKLELDSKGTALEDKVYTIGGAYQAGELDAKRAIDMGTRLAMEIHNDAVVPGKHKFEAPAGAEEKVFEFLKRWL
jgi:2,4-dienoyl-CoA reductase (NADPH2)